MSTHREDAELTLNNAEICLNKRAGTAASTDFAVANFLNVMAIASLAQTRALLDIADAIRETRQENTP